jgi:TRAP-type mannitol/chloroaromatic compound transport system permease small subunit
MLEKFEMFNRRISGWFEWIGLVGLMLMMVTTCVDVVGAKVFLWRLFGAIDMVMLSQLVAISFATGMALILGRHIRVEFFYNMWSRRTQAMIDCAVLFLQIGLFIMIIWRLCVLGYSFQTSGEYSATAHIPYYPFAYGAALACVPVCLVLLLELMLSLRKVVQR